VDSLRNTNVPLDLTLGAGTGSLSGPFAGFQLPIIDQFLLFGEYRIDGPMIGVEVRPVRFAFLRYCADKRNAYWQAGANIRF
jgi:hypothetical protein